MKIKFLIALLFCNFCYVQASGKAYESAREQLATYFKTEIAEKQRVEDARTAVLVMAARSLQKGITRKQFKVIRNQLAQGLLPSPANEPILGRLQSITENHARKFPLCCSPWVYQSTIDREADSLYATIDAILKQEHADTYTALQSAGKGSGSVHVVQAFAVPSAPMLNERLLGQHGQNIK
jgi:hypothetical protein